MGRVAESIGAMDVAEFGGTGSAIGRTSRRSPSHLTLVALIAFAIVPVFVRILRGSSPTQSPVS
jgi:hypothetical protein